MESLFGLTLQPKNLGLFLIWLHDCWRSRVFVALITILLSYLPACQDTSHLPFNDMSRCSQYARCSLLEEGCSLTQWVSFQACIIFCKTPVPVRHWHWTYGKHLVINCILTGWNLSSIACCNAFYSHVVWGRVGRLALSSKRLSFTFPTRPLTHVSLASFSDTPLALPGAACYLESLVRVSSSGTAPLYCFLWQPVFPPAPRKKNSVDLQNISYLCRHEHCLMQRGIISGLDHPIAASCP